MTARTIGRQICGLLVTALVGGLAAATLVRLAPGSGVDEREFDPRLSESSVQALRASRAESRNVGKFYLNYLSGLVRGDFGVSSSLRRPVAELLAERGPVTLHLAGCGLAGGWALGLSLAVLAAARSRPTVALFSSSLCALLLCLPAALIGLVVLFARAGGWWAIALIVFPKIFSYARSLLEKVSRQPYIVLARAKGLGDTRIWLRHILPGAMPELLALAGVSVSLAFSAAIPVEAVCDIPGVGQLAWQAALGRDLPVLVTATLLLVLITRLANLTADAAVTAFRPETA